MDRLPELDGRHQKDHDIQELFELISEDGWLNVYQGELEVRPPGAPTTDKLGGLFWTGQPIPKSFGDFSLAFASRRQRMGTRCFSSVNQLRTTWICVVVDLDSPCPAETTPSIRPSGITS